MTVTGYLSLYTTLLGWQQYQSLWEIACHTGLIYLPFIGMMLSSLLPVLTSGAAIAEMSLGALKILLIKLCTTLLVIAFAAVPWMPLNPGILHVEALCQDQQAPMTAGHTDTTYDKSFPIPTGVKVPVFWYLVMAVCNGITHAASISLPCEPLDYRALHTQLETAQIEDPQLKRSVEQFYRDCYLPAYSRYLNQQGSEQNQTVDSLIKTHGVEDVQWLGSQTFLNAPGFYDTDQATQPVNGFPFDPTRDIELGQLAQRGMHGTPTCQTWWNAPHDGLHAQLKRALPPTFWQKLSAVGEDRQVVEDAAIRTLLTQQSQHFSVANALRGYESLNNNRVTGDYLSRLISAPVGVALESLNFYPKLHLLINALPIIQGTLLFALYAFLGLGVVFSSYRIQFCITGAMMIFSVIFCSFLWHVVQWFDHLLIASLYPTFDNFILKNLQSMNPNQILVDMIIGTLYIGLPLIWLMVMGWAGFRAGFEFNGLFNSLGSPAQQSGHHVGQMVRSAVTQATFKKLL